MVSPSAAAIVVLLLLPVADAIREDSDKFEQEHSSHLANEKQAHENKEAIADKIHTAFKRKGNKTRGVDGVVILGDSYSDSGLEGLGNANLELAEVGGYPALAQRVPFQNIKLLRFGEGYPYESFSYYKQKFSDGPTWADHFKSLGDVHNFAHGSASSCQGGESPNGVLESVSVPDGYIPIATTTGFATVVESTVYPRGVAQQIDQMKAYFGGEMAAKALNHLFIIFIGTNDILYEFDVSMGAGPAQAAGSKYVTNLKKIQESLVGLGVPAQNIVFSGMTAVDISPMIKIIGHEKSSPAWLEPQVAAINAAIDAVPLQRWDVDGFMRRAMSDPTVCCSAYTEMGSWDATANAATIGAASIIPKCSKACKSAWWDEIHPSAAAHKAMFDDFMGSWGSKFFG